MSGILKILHLEDVYADADLVQVCLRKAGMTFTVKVVADRESFIDALTVFCPDIILSDHTMPQFDSTEALEIFKASGLNIPFILVTGSVSEEFAVSCIRNGADDYILKSNIKRIPLSITNSLEKKKLQQQKKETYDKLILSEARLKKFTLHLHTLIEEERARIAREIHDELGQQLTGIKIGLTLCKKNDGLSKKTEEKIIEIIKEVDTVNQSLKKIATQLRPGILDTLGLIPSIEWLSKEFEKKTGTNCGVKLNVREEVFNKNISICFFRICQEALTNISKYAGATQATVEVQQYENELMLKVSDNGKGMASEKAENPFSLGLIGMHERANIIGGELLINSKKDIGTTIQLRAKIN